MLSPKNNHLKCRQNAVFIWKGLYSEVFLIHKKTHPFQNPWLLLGDWLLFGRLLLGLNTDPVSYLLVYLIEMKKNGNDVIFIQGHQFQYCPSQCGKQQFSEKRINICSVGILFNDRQTDARTDKHKQTTIKIF